MKETIDKLHETSTQGVKFTYVMSNKHLALMGISAVISVLVSMWIFKHI